MTKQARDWNKQPPEFFDASPLHRQLYTRAYNELQNEHPNVPIPASLINERIQRFVNEQSPLPSSIWIDTAALHNLWTRGYADYYLTPYAIGDEFGPSDGCSLEYVRRVVVLREAAALTCRYCGDSEKYGIASRDPEYDLFSHTKHRAVWCEAQPIQQAIANELEKETK